MTAASPSSTSAALISSSLLATSRARTWVRGRARVRVRVGVGVRVKGER